jgi:hypothetical protein
VQGSGLACSAEEHVRMSELSRPAALFVLSTTEEITLFVDKQEVGENTQIKVPQFSLCVK